MRNLAFKDAFALSRIIKKANVKPEFKQGVTQEELGYDVIFSLLEGAGNVENEVTTLLADILEVTPEAMANMDMGEAVKKLQELSNMPGIKDFFIVAARLTK